MSFQGYVNTAGDPPDSFTTNGLAFETREEARKYVSDLASRWTAVRKTEVRESDLPVNRRITQDNVMEKVE
jgi:hypothetical protein